MEFPHIKYELSFEEYQNLVEQFNNLVKTNDFKPLYYKDYRKIAGKHLNGIVSKVIIEFVDESHFIITFHPTKETIYTGNIFDLSFGTFINYFNFEEEPKEKMEKNNTYDIWGNGISNIANNTSNTTDSVSSQKTISYSDYDGATSVEPDSGYLNRVVSNSDSLSVFAYDLSKNVRRDVDDVISKIDKLEEKINNQEVKAKEDIDCIQNQLTNLSTRITDSEYSLCQVQKVSEVLRDRISELDEKQEKRNKCSVRKDNEKIMNTNKMFNFDFGFVDSNIRMSPYGMAIRNADGRYVSYDVKTGSVIDVEPFNFEGHRLMMKMPVAIKDVAIGDIVIHNHKPMFVVNTNDKVTVIDIYNGEEKNILLTRSIFGFDFITKVVSFINFSNASVENPFGNMWPLFMLSDSNSGFGLNGANSEDSRTTMLMLMAMMSQGSMPANMFQNPMFMMAFMNDGNSNMQDLMITMAMSSAMNNNTDFKVPTAPAVTPPNNQ